MRSTRLLALAAMIAVLPSLAVAQGKSQKGHMGPPMTVRKAPVVHNEIRRNDAAKDAAKASNKADKVADKTERTSEKAERSALDLAHDQKHLTQGIKLTSSEKSQIKAIEKNYDKQYRALRQTDKRSDNTAKKNGTTETDAAFQTQLSQLQTQERAELRAALSPAQQTIFDSNVAKLSTHK